ncbi:MAG: DJ-1/PfpI family protein [Ruminococcus sp.]|nr:DJ-1/PfpI family protein [Ruminococcus sp.]
MFYCFLADGFEEIEALATVDILRRADIGVTTVGVGSKLICGAHDIPVTADMHIDEFEINEDMSGVILPGGMPGVKNLYAEERVRDAVSYCVSRDLYVCAICAAPSILGKMGVLMGRKATCFPGFEDELLEAEVSAEKVVVDGKIITAKGAGCALDFGFAIVAQVESEREAERIAKSMQC